jgi:hypothetical protein
VVDTVLIIVTVADVCIVTVLELVTVATVVTASVSPTVVVTVLYGQQILVHIMLTPREESMSQS